MGGKHPVLFPPELVEAGMYNKQCGKLEGNSWIAGTSGTRAHGIPERKEAMLSHLSPSTPDWA